MFVILFPSQDMNWDSQFNSILSVADGSVAKMRVSPLKFFYLTLVSCIFPEQFLIYYF